MGKKQFLGYKIVYICFIQTNQRFGLFKDVIVTAGWMGIGFKSEKKSNANVNEPASK